MKKILQTIPFPEVTIFIFIINLIVLMLYFFIRSHLPPEVPLLYGLPNGGEQLVKRDLLISPIIASLFIVVLNSILITTTKDNFSQKALLYLMIATSLLGIVTVIKIALLVGAF